MLNVIKTENRHSGLNEEIEEIEEDANVAHVSIDNRISSLGDKMIS